MSIDMLVLLVHTTHAYTREMPRTLRLFVMLVNVICILFRILIMQIVTGLIRKDVK